jgi:NADPH-dependent curcumin reductase CurA
MANANVNQQWLLARRPVGAVVPEDFRLANSPIPEPGENEVLVRVLYFGFDASQRIWLTDHGGYMPPIQIGEPMRTMGLGQVVTSRDPDYKAGDFVEGFMSWQNYVVARSDGPMPLRVLPKADYPLTWNLSILGVSGLTAYFGVTDVLNVGPGDTVFVSAATGATGSLVAAICKARGAKRVIGAAGGAEKCRWIIEQAGFDDAIDYKSEDLSDRLSALCPGGINAYFDNVGGEMLDTTLLHMAPMGRILICGAMSSGYVDEKVPGPQQNFMQICVKMLSVKGILLLFYRDQLAQGARQMGDWLAEGKIPVHENIIEGFDRAPVLLGTMFSGKAPGKLILKIAEPF